MNHIQRLLVAIEWFSHVQWQLNGIPLCPITPSGNLLRKTKELYNHMQRKNNPSEMIVQINRMASKLLTKAMQKLHAKNQELEKQRQRIQATSTQPQKTTSAAMTPPPPIELTHQWLPPVVRSVCHDILQPSSHATIDLQWRMHHLLSVIATANPYAHLHVIYRPPPAHVQERYEVTQSATIDAMRTRLTQHLFHLRKERHWLQSSKKHRAGIEPAWKRVQKLMDSVHLFALRFHFVVVHLYAVAMGRHDPATTWDSINEQATKLQRSSTSRYYGLALNALSSTNDRLVLQTTRYCPEVLVYVDQWRREPSFHEYGFSSASSTATAFHFDFTPGRDQMLQGIGWNLQVIGDVWDASALGKAFANISIHEIGHVELQVKTHLASIINAFYCQNLARWTERVRARQRFTMELTITKPKEDEQERTSRRKRQRSTSPKRHDASKPSVRRAFRAPTCCLLLDLCTLRSKSTGASRSFDYERLELDALRTLPVLLKHVYAWTDDEIDLYEQETEQIFAWQNQLMVLRDQTTTGKVVRSTSAMGLLQSCWRVRQKTTEAAATGERIALHSAAEALIKRPSLRVLKEQENEDDDEEDEEDEHGVQVPAYDAAAFGQLELPQQLRVLHQLREGMLRLEATDDGQREAVALAQQLQTLLTALKADEDQDHDDATSAPAEVESTQSSQDPTTRIKKMAIAHLLC